MCGRRPLLLMATCLRCRQFRQSFFLFMCIKVIFNVVAPLTGLEDHFLSVFAFYETIVLKWKLKFLAFDVPESPRLRIKQIWKLGLLFELMVYVVFVVIHN